MSWTRIPAQSVTGADHSRVSQSKRGCGIERARLTRWASYGNESTTHWPLSPRRRSDTFGRSRVTSSIVGLTVSRGSDRGVGRLRLAWLVVAGGRQVVFA